MERDELYALAGEIAKHLPGKWRFNEVASEIEEKQCHSCSAILSNDQAPAERMEIRQGWREQGKLTVAGVWPKGHNWYDTRGSAIGVSASRPAKSIAGDIARRFLPVYRQLLPQQQAFVQQTLDTKAAHELRIETMRRVVASLEHNRHGGHSSDFWYETRRGKGNVRMYQTSSDDCVTVEARVSYADAVRLLAWLHRPWDLSLPDEASRVSSTPLTDEDDHADEPGALARADGEARAHLQERGGTERQERAHGEGLAEARDEQVSP
ncbi:MAG: hypothetical protein GC190_21815 [Alphaproteobacteria bacterium]|nr:hypothetical protein [Alphaproteobacteria bacterium]